MHPRIRPQLTHGCSRRTPYRPSILSGRLSRDGCREGRLPGSAKMGWWVPLSRHALSVDDRGVAVCAIRTAVLPRAPSARPLHADQLFDIQDADLARGRHRGRVDPGGRQSGTAPGSRRVGQVPCGAPVGSESRWPPARPPAVIVGVGADDQVVLPTRTMVGACRWTSRGWRSRSCFPRRQRRGYRGCRCSGRSSACWSGRLPSRSRPVMQSRRSATCRVQGSGLRERRRSGRSGWVAVWARDHRRQSCSIGSLPGRAGSLRATNRIPTPRC